MVKGKAIYSCYQLVGVPYVPEVMIGNNFGLGKTRQVELQGACETLGIARKDRCLAVDYAYFLSFSVTVLRTGHYKITRRNGGIQTISLRLSRKWSRNGKLMQLSHLMIME